MKILSDILNNVSLRKVSGKMDLKVNSVSFDSRQIGAGTLFVAMKGTQVDGHIFIAKAIEKGASAILCQCLPENLFEGVTYIEVEDSSYALGIVSSNFYDKPSEKIKLVGVTGTNGKTTVATLLFQLFRELGYNVGLLSTVENKINDSVIPSTHTTPDAIGLNALISKMLERGCTHCFMEVSSHSIHQNRIAGLHFTGALFTNISHDHLDYHKTFANYIAAKKSFFDLLPKSSFALVNGDDKRANVMLQNTKASKSYFALKTPADFKGRILENTLQGLEMNLNGRDIWLRLIGEFNAYNISAVFGAACLLGEDEEEILQSISLLNSVNGRFQQINSSNGLIGVIDYAHTPDALENVLKTLGQFRTGGNQLITLVGCGGDRDIEKRPIMASIACEHSDRVILTSDNPRSERPSDILAQMNEGVSITQRKKVLTLEDRQEAIKLAATLANTGDIILLAGKGHENYQEMNGKRRHFDDREELMAVFQLLDK